MKAYWGTGAGLSREATRMRVVTEGLYTSLQWSFLRRRFWTGELYWSEWYLDDYYCNLTGSTASLAESAMHRYEEQMKESEKPFRVIATSEPK